MQNRAFPSLLLVLFGLFTTLGCQSNQSSGSANLVASIGQALSSSDVTRIVVTVSGNDFSPPRVAELSQVNGQWQGLIGGIPVGGNRLFVAEAFAADNTLLFTGQAGGVVISAGRTVVVSIVLQPIQRPPPPGNLPPVIDALVASDSTVVPGGTLNFQATAHDPNPDDLITYTWTASVGTFGPAAGTAISWTAPQSTGLATLRLTVMDPHGAASSMEWTVSIQRATGSAHIIIRLNTWPHISSISATPSPVAVGQPAAVRVASGDLDGDPLSYQWSANGCTGAWQGATTHEAQFTPDALPAGGACSCQLSVSVSDGLGGQVSRTLALCVQATTELPQPPVVTGTYQSATSAPGGSQVLLRVVAEDPQGESLSFSWASTEGTLGTPTNGPGQSEVTWTAPACVPMGTTPAMKVTVSNARGLSTTATFRVEVLACGPTGPRSSPWTFLGGTAQHWAKHAAALLASGNILIAGGSFSEEYNPASDTSAPTKPLATWHGEEVTLTPLPNNKFLLVGSGQAEVYDPDTQAWSSAGYVGLAYGGHTATQLDSNKVLVAGGDSESAAAIFEPSTGTWSSTGNMTTKRMHHTATRLSSGKVLVTGGHSSEYSVSLGTAELYDPVTGTWSATGSMITPRAQHTATLLPSGKVLVAGGVFSSTALASAELYDPSTGMWSPAGSMAVPRQDHIAVVLETSPNQANQVLFSGGSNSNVHASVDLYNLTTGAWSTGNSMKFQRANHTATRLPSGKIVVVGGETARSTVEVYTPSTGQWAATSAPLFLSSYQPSSALLQSDDVFVMGDYGAAIFNPAAKQWTHIQLPNSDLRDSVATSLDPGNVFLVGGTAAATYNPGTNTWSSLPTPSRWYRPVATLLASDNVLVYGDRTLTTADVYNTATATRSTTGPLSMPRYGFTATSLDSGKVLVAGGQSDSGPTDTAELFDPQTATWRLTASMATPCSSSVAAKLHSGDVFVVGCTNPNTAALYKPSTETWSPLPAPPTQFYPWEAKVLDSGKVLVLGHEMSQLFDPATSNWSPAGNSYGGGTSQLLSSGEVLVFRNGLVPALYTP